MSGLSFIGLGLNNELGLTLQGLEIAKKADIVMVELYTSPIPELNLRNLEKLIGNKVKLLRRDDLEENAKNVILKQALDKSVALLVPGDPMVATTHVALRLQAEKMGIKTGVVHASSIISAIAGVTGLQIYKFGRTITIPFDSSGDLFRSTYIFLEENEKNKLHTLALLDIDIEKGVYLKIDEAIKELLLLEQKMRHNVINKDKLAIGLAMIGSEKIKVKAAKIKELINYEFDSPPYSIVFPGKLHFLEAEELQVFCKADKKDLEGYI